MDNPQPVLGAGMSGRRARFEIVRTSFAILFFELICIRWIPGQVRYISYFMNFILLASFLGVGLGILSARKRLPVPPFPVLLVLLVILVTFNRFEFAFFSPDVLYFGAGETVAASEKYYVLPLIFVAVAITFIPLARPLGPLLKSLPPLEAYGFDILGSLCGVAAFFAISALHLPPWCWFSVLGVISLPMAQRRTLYLAPLYLAAVLLSLHSAEGDHWSPYYRVKVVKNDAGSYDIHVNNSNHQRIQPHQGKETFYFRAYDLFGHGAFKKVLILGAGSGSDVAIALAQGAEKVDAVEIDPVIQQLGRDLHPEQPFSDPRVTVHVDDGRAFLRKSQEKYDLIVYALPDSLTLTSGFASLRLESFLLTVESFKSARDHLSSNGLLVAYNYYRYDWLVQKLAGMVEVAFGSPPYVTTYGDWGRAAVLMAGPRLEQRQPPLDAEYLEGGLGSERGSGAHLPMIGVGRIRGKDTLSPATDDWPFVYMPVPAIPVIYLVSLGLISGIAVILLVVVSPSGTLGGFDWQMFFLGSAFMLLETRSLVSFGLLFGTTWMVNSLVFFAVLTSVLLAILANRRLKLRRVGTLYLALLATLALNLLIPVETLLGIDAPLFRYALASMLTFAPIFVANLVFSRSFRETETADLAFASNLLGIMFGGMFEYAALVFGYRLLLIPIMAFYVLAFVFWRLLAVTRKENPGSPGATVSRGVP